MSISLGFFLTLHVLFKQLSRMIDQSGNRLCFKGIPFSSLANTKYFTILSNHDNTKEPHYGVFFKQLV